MQSDSRPADIGLRSRHSKYQRRHRGTQRHWYADLRGPYSQHVGESVLPRSTVCPSGSGFLGAHSAHYPELGWYINYGQVSGDHGLNISPSQIVSSTDHDFYLDGLTQTPGCNGFDGLTPAISVVCVLTASDGNSSPSFVIYLILGELYGGSSKRARWSPDGAPIPTHWRRFLRFRWVLRGTQPVSVECNTIAVSFTRELLYTTRHRV